MCQALCLCLRALGAVIHLLLIVIHVAAAVTSPLLGGELKHREVGDWSTVTGLGCRAVI